MAGDGMRLNSKIFLMIVVGAAVLVFASVAALVSFDINDYKTGIETAVSEATGVEVTIKGKIRISLFPLGILVRDVHVSGRGGEFLVLDALTLRADLRTLLKKELKFTGGELLSPNVTIIKDAEGKYNYESKMISAGPGAAFALTYLKLSRGTLVYLDKRTGERIEFKDLTLSIKDLAIADTSANLLRNLSFIGNIDCKEILRKDFKIGDINAQVEAIKGIFNIDPLSASSLAYYNTKTAQKTELKGITFNVKNLSIAETPGGLLSVLSFTGNMECRELNVKDLKMEAVRSGVKIDKGMISLTPLTLNVFGGSGDGDAFADMSKADAIYRLNLKVPKIDFEKFSEYFKTNKVIGGKSDLFVAVTIKERAGLSLLKETDGTLAIEGRNLTIYSMDLDKVLTKYETSQKFNLVDLGAFFVAGPLSTVALKGFRYGDLFVRTRGGHGTVTKLVSRWRIKDGKAEALDCALATQHHRVALKGKLNLVSEHYENVTVAILDEKGCAEFKQPISGPFGSPEIGTVSTIESVAGPIISLYSKTKRLLGGGKCEVFYKGSVQPSH